MYSLIFILIAAGLLLTQALMGGVTLFFGLPGYGLIGLAAVLTCFLSERRLRHGISRPALVSALVLASYVLLRSQLSPIPYLARADAFMVLGALAVYLLTACFFKHPRERLLMLYILLGFSLLHVIAGLGQFSRANQFMLMQLWPDGWFIPRLFRPDYGWRASGFYGCPNHLAGLLEVLAILALACAFFARAGTARRFVNGYFFLICVAGLMFTGSRGGYLSISVGVVVLIGLSLWAVRKLRPKIFTRTVAISVLAVALVVTVGGKLVSRSAAIEGRVDDIGEMENVRLLLWDAAIRQFQTAPVFGTGSGTYLYYGREFREKAVQGDAIHVHNDYLELLAEYGVVGALLVAVFAVLHLRSGWKGISDVVRFRLRPAKRMASDELALSLGSMGAVAALVVHSILDFNFHIPGNTLIYAFLFGMLASPSLHRKVVQTEPPPRFARWVLPGVGVLILVAGLPRLKGEYHAEWARVQLRNLQMADALFDAVERTSSLMAAIAPNVPQPSAASDFSKMRDATRRRLLAEARAQAEAGVAAEKKNPNLFYYLGEARRLQAGALLGRERKLGETADPRRAAELLAEAAAAYAEGLKLFERDVRLLLKTGQVLDGLKNYDAAEKFYLQVMAIDPNLAEGYARYGVHLFQRRKLLRAEAYYQRAAQLDPNNPIPWFGLQDIAALRARSYHPNYVEQFGDPLEDWDMEVPTAEDEKRGVVSHE